MQQLDNSLDCNSDTGFVVVDIDFVVAVVVVDKLAEATEVVVELLEEEVVVFVVVVEWVE